MKRIHLFEIEDLAACPRWMRECITLFLVGFHRLLGTSQSLIPLLEKCLARSPQPQIIDLCSGGGGPMVEAWTLLVQKPAFKDLRLTLTDLFPNEKAAEATAGRQQAGLEYRMSPVDATDLSLQLGGLRTMICALHHMRPTIAQAILKDAFLKKQPICVYELSDNALPLWMGWIALPFGFLMALIVTPFIRPLTLAQLVFTYIIPILPFAIAWDTAVSNVRVYTKADLEELLQGLQSLDYEWEIGTVSKTLFPAKMLYLLGLPRS